MNKSTIVAVTAAAMLGFGGVGTAMANTEISGHGDIRWGALDSDGEEGAFVANGELDVVHNGEGASLRLDLDLLNALNSHQGSITSSTGVDVEQLALTVPAGDMVTVMAGILNSPVDPESQDATGINFAENGLLFQALDGVHTVVGGVAAIAPTDTVTVLLGFLNSALTPVQGASVDNSIYAGLRISPVEGVSVDVNYLTEPTDTVGDVLGIGVGLDLVENLHLSADYLAADPAVGAGSLDNGFGIEAAYHMDKLTGAVRYEDASYEAAGSPDTTEISVAVTHECSENLNLRVDWTNVDMDTAGSQDTATVQAVYSF